MIGVCAHGRMCCRSHSCLRFAASQRDVRENALGLVHTRTSFVCAGGVMFAATFSAELRELGEASNASRGTGSREGVARKLP